MGHRHHRHSRWFAADPFLHWRQSSPICALRLHSISPNAPHPCFSPFSSFRSAALHRKHVVSLDFWPKSSCTLGSIRFAALYLFCGIGGQFLYLFLNLHSNIPLVGASGAISGIAGFYFVVFPHDRFNLHLYFGWWKVAKIDSTTRSAVGAWIGEQLLLALLTRLAPFSSVAFWAHIGGFATGAMPEFSITIAFQK